MLAMTHSKVKKNDAPRNRAVLAGESPNLLIIIPIRISRNSLPWIL